MNYDKVIIGGGLYGLYAALLCGKNKERVLLLECDKTPFKRATTINQARVHMGYHYPRSLSTAIKSAGYFERFVEDYGFCIKQDFEQIYATSKHYSWTNAEQFRKFCRDAEIPCEDVRVEKYFKPNQCDGAFLTKEYTYDAGLLKDFFLKEIAAFSNVELKFGCRVEQIHQEKEYYEIKDSQGNCYCTEYILNASYASTNQIISMLGMEPFPIKYELCEIILCEIGEPLKNTGITVMDGPFFSIMPFGKTGLHSLTSVTFTPHKTDYHEVPHFPCQKDSGGRCTPQALFNCNDCPAKPESAWPYMSRLAGKYLREEYQFSYVKSLYSMKPILVASEVDDSRPTVIRIHHKNPYFVSVLSGKINTVYDLDEVILNEIK